MKYLVLAVGVVLFASHMTTNDKALQEALNGNYKKAFSMFNSRCQKNEGYACGMVGYFYDKGFGVEKNHKMAIKFYKKGCDLNDADSCTLLGYYYYKENKKEAKDLLNKACKLKNKDACKYLKNIK